MMKVETLTISAPMRELKGPKKGNAKAKNQRKIATGNLLKVRMNHRDRCTLSSFSHMK
jgi:hypothetical protein